MIAQIQRISGMHLHEDNRAEHREAKKHYEGRIAKWRHVMVFMLTFLSIGAITDFKKLAEAKFGRMVFVYFVALFVFVIPVALIVAWVFHHGMSVPVKV